MSYTANDSCD